MGARPLPIGFEPQLCYRIETLENRSTFSPGATALLLSFAGIAIGGLVWGAMLNVDNANLRLLVTSAYFLAWSAFSSWRFQKLIVLEQRRQQTRAETDGRELNLNSEGILLSGLLVYPWTGPLSFAELGQGSWYRIPWQAIEEWHTIRARLRVRGGDLKLHLYLVSFKSGDGVRIPQFSEEIESEFFRMLKEHSQARILGR